MYQALYRKYRPQNFDDVIGQDVIVRTLRNEIINNKLSHAYLFCGPRGTGKTSIAKIFAKVINCENQINGCSCGKCVNCTQIIDGRYVDIVEIDAASNNGVDEIRDLKNKINFVPSLGKYKVYIVDEVHMLSTGAFNALLKTLEEPPAHVIFILATTDPQKIPLTILSRCQRFDFKKIDPKHLSERLDYIISNEKIGADSDVSTEIARLCDGGMRDAVGLLDQLSSYCTEKITVKDVHEMNGTVTDDEILAFINYVFSHDLNNVFNFLDSCDYNGKNIVKIIDEIIEYLKKCLVFKLNIDIQASNLEKLNSDVTSNDIINLLEIINKDYFEIKKSNNPKLVFELTLIKFINNLSSLNSIIKNSVKERKVDDIEIKNNTSKSYGTSNSVKDEFVVEKNNLHSTATSDQSNSEVITNSNSDDKANYFPGNKIDADRKKIRIGNSLSGFSRKNTLDLKNDLKIVEEYNLDKKYGKISTLIMDGALKSKGNDYLIFVYKNQIESDEFNNSLKIIEEFLEKILNHKYKVISTTSDEWDIIKSEFNKDKTKYIFVDEDIFDKNESNNNGEIENLFGSLIEYK